MSKTGKLVKARDASAPSTFHEPQPGWVPLQKALPYCGGDTLDTGANAVAADTGANAVAALRHAVERRAQLICCEPPPPPCVVGLEFSWRVEQTSDGVCFTTSREAGPEIWTLFGINGGLRTSGGDPITFEGWWLMLREDASQWDEQVPPRDRNLAELHRVVRDCVEDDLKAKFQRFVRDGRIHIMARPTVLAPFQRILWDQWQFFKIHEPTRRDSNQWQEPWWSDQRPLSIESPSGERLYSIYAAPGVTTSAKSAPQTPEEMTLRWLIELMQAYPDRAPNGKDRVADQANKLFGVSRRTFEHIYKQAQQLTGNNRWSEARRPPKTPSLISAK